MKRFGELLNDAIGKKSNITDVADFCGINVRTIYRYIKGERIPEEELVEKLGRFLMMDPKTKSDFMRAYQAAVIGEDTYYRREMIDAFLHTIFAMKYTDDDQQFELQGKEFPLPAGVEPVDTTEKLHQFINIMLKNEAYKEGDGRVYVVSGPENTEIFDALKVICRTNVRIEHILSLNADSNASLNQSTCGIHYLTHLAPLMMIAKNYYANSYFSPVGYGTNPPNLNYPEILITSEAVLIYSNEFGKGVFFNDGKMREYFLFNFNELKKTTNEFAHAVIGAQLSGGFLREMKKVLDHKSSVYSIAVMCEAPGISDDLVDKYVNCGAIPGKEIDAFKLYLNQIRSLCMSDDKSIDCQSEQGFRRFLDTGIIPDIPDDFYYPLAKLDRLQIVKNLYNIHLKRKVKLRFLKEEWEIGDYNMCFTISPNTLFVYFKKNTGQTGYYTIEDPKTTLAFSDYLNNAIESIAFTEEESLKKLYSIIQEYSNKWFGKDADIQTFKAKIDE